jgi:AcrR family transcriptional regulator
MEAAPKPRYGGGRGALIEAAIRVVAAEGLRGLTIRSVAAEAGVTHGLVRHHFGSRDALVEATLIRSVELAIEAASLAPGRGRIDEISVDLGSTAETHEELLAFQYELLLEARRRPELREHVERMYDDYISVVEDELEQAGFGKDPVAARVLFAALDGLVLQQVVFGKRERTEAGVELIHTLFETLLEHRRRDR